MQSKFLRSLTVTLLFSPLFSIAQIPNLGGAADYAVFTADGAFFSSGNSLITGNVGTAIGTFGGLTQANVIGEIHVADTTATRIAGDVQDAYTSFSSIGNTAVLGVGLGNGQTVTAGVYTIGGLSTLNGILNIDAENNPNAIFIFKIGAAMSTGISASVTLVNGAKWQNIYWQIGGQFDLGQDAAFEGTLVVDGAIHLAENAQLNGRALSRTGEITMDNNIVSNLIIPGILPVTLTGFAAGMQGNNALITWSTSNEKNSYDFTVERSTTGQMGNWETVATIKSAGNSTLNNQYKTTDNNVADGINYYRLRSNDVGGSYSLSSTVSVKFSKMTSTVVAYPNPVQDQLTVTGTDKGSTITMMDMNGRIVATHLTNGGNDLIKTSNLLPGNYLLKVITQGGHTTNLTLNKR